MTFSATGALPRRPYDSHPHVAGASLTEGELPIGQLAQGKGKGKGSRSIAVTKKKHWRFGAYQLHDLEIEIGNLCLTAAHAFRSGTMKACNAG